MGRYVRSLFIAASMGLGLAPRAPSQTAPRSDTSRKIVTIIIDAVSMSDTGRAAVLRSLAYIRPVSQWDTSTVATNRNLAAIVKDRYQYNSKQPESLSALLAVVANANGVRDTARIAAG